MREPPGRRTAQTGRIRSFERGTGTGVADDGTPQLLTWTEDEPWRRRRAVALGASQKSNSPSPGAGSQGRTVPKTCSPVRQCTPALGMEQTTKAAQQRGEAKTLTRLDVFCTCRRVRYIEEPTTSYHDPFRKFKKLIRIPYLVDLKAK